MAKRSTTATASRKVAAVEDDEEDDEEEVVVVSAKKKTAAPAAKTANGRANGKATAKATVTKKPAKAAAEDDEEAAYTPNANSMRDFVMRALRRGGTSAEIKKRAARTAERAGVETLSDAKAYKNFDVAFFAKFLKGKGFDVDVDEENDSYTLNG